MPTHQQLIDAATSLVEPMRAAGRSAELARRPDDDVVAKARESGIFTLMSPRCYGGSELDLDTFFEVGLILGEAEASHGWVFCFYIEHVWMFCQYPETFQKELFDGRSFVLAPGMLSPAGKAEPVEGGFRLSGRWPWGTGVVQADWIIAGAMLKVGEKVRPTFFALPVEETSWEDTWHMDGLCGTGSHDVIINDVFVPADRAVDIGEMMNATAAGSRVHSGPLYSTPMAPILSLAASLPLLGIAKSTIAEFARQLAGRKDLSGMVSQSGRADRQALLGRAELDVRAAEALMRSVVADVMTWRGRADEARRVGWTSSIAHAVNICRTTVDELCDAGGSTAHNLDNPLQRARRDINTGACHTVFDTFERHRSLGRTLLGMPSESRWH